MICYHGLISERGPRFEAASWIRFQSYPRPESLPMSAAAQAADSPAHDIVAVRQAAERAPPPCPVSGEREWDEVGGKKFDRAGLGWCLHHPPTLGSRRLRRGPDAGVPATQARGSDSQKGADSAFSQLELSNRVLTQRSP